ncbi:TIGR01906 family membrane protein [Thermocrinis jamiesonii]|uniref:TIGR01906 family membrane protein n=1 Tax=Thermocrinis jamiesonii TaxID=1302351 RepID=UPI000494E660|nr:TIGR01906 family membrane protein [Thermocrinis jamiesonii]
MKRVIALSFFFPFLLIFLCVRLAFTEFFVELNYRFGNLPPDRWGMDQERRLEIAKLGLRSVLSDKGMEEFISSGLFREKEIKHMQDVKRLLSVIFKVLYFGLPLWLFLFFSLRDKKKMGLVLFSGALLTEILVIFVLVFSLLNYDLLFEVFHNFFFDPHSWRFFDQDMLLRVYPMKFWYNATLWVCVFSLLLNSSFQALGLILWKKVS